jgi:hypothetical protein
MDFRVIGWGCGVDSTGSGLESLVVSCEGGDEPSGSDAMELVDVTE